MSPLVPWNAGGAFVISVLGLGIATREDLGAAAGAAVLPWNRTRPQHRPLLWADSSGRAIV